MSVRHIVFNDSLCVNDKNLYCPEFTCFVKHIATFVPFHGFPVPFGCTAWTRNLVT